MAAKKTSGKKIAGIAVAVVVVALLAASAFLKMPGASARTQLEPFFKQWFMENRPDVPRGLLSKNFIMDGEGQSVVNRVALTGMFTNVVARPNFISYELKSIGEPTFEAIRAFTDLPMFTWTLKSQEELDTAKALGFDAFIFDSFEAKQ